MQDKFLFFLGCNECIACCKPLSLQQAGICWWIKDKHVNCRDVLNKKQLKTYRKFYFPQGRSENHNFFFNNFHETYSQVNQGKRLQSKWSEPKIKSLWNQLWQLCPGGTAAEVQGRLSRFWNHFLPRSQSWLSRPQCTLSQ